jgi:hypothetical protein
MHELKTGYCTIQKPKIGSVELVLFGKPKLDLAVPIFSICKLAGGPKKMQGINGRYGYETK